MVFNGKRFAALGVDGSDVLLYFLESALDFPSCGIKLDHLFCGKRNVGGDQRESKAFVIYENDFDLTSERLGYAEQLGKFDFAVFAVGSWPILRTGAVERKEPLPVQAVCRTWGGVRVCRE